MKSQGIKKSNPFLNHLMFKVGMPARVGVSSTAMIPTLLTGAKKETSFEKFRLLKGKKMKVSECVGCKKKLSLKQKRVVLLGRYHFCLKCGRDKIDKEIKMHRKEIGKLWRIRKKIKDGDIIMEAI